MIVASLTTIPSRLPFLQKTISSILADRGFDKVILTIPSKTLKGHDYPVEEITKLSKKFNGSDRFLINTIPEDYGPITKLVGCLDIITDPETVIVVFDDDRQLLKPVSRIFHQRCVSDPSCAFSLGGWCFGSGYRIQVENIEDVEVDTLMGTTCIAFRRDLINKEELLNFRREDKRLVKLDDMRISGYLSSKGKRRISVGFNAREYLKDIEYQGTEKLSGNFNFWVDNKAVIDQLRKEGIFKIKSSEGSSFEAFVFYIILSVLVLLGGLWSIYNRRTYGYILLVAGLIFACLAIVQIQSFIL